MQKKKKCNSSNWKNIGVQVVFRLGNVHELKRTPAPTTRDFQQTYSASTPGSYVTHNDGIRQWHGGSGLLLVSMVT